MALEILGQEKALVRLSRMLSARKIPSALLFWGPEGVGKRLAARWFAAQLNGRADHPAVAEVDAAFQAAVLDEPVEKIRSVRVDTVRELTRRASLKADPGVWKAFIVDDAETLEIPAANALLKALEEPEPDTVWILVTSRRERLLPTVRSRCQEVAFRTLPDDVLRRLAAREGGLETGAVARWSAAAQGSLGRLARLARSGGLADQGRRDAGAYWAVSQSLPRELAQARETVEGVLDALLAEQKNRESTRGEQSRTRIENRDKLLRLKRALRANVSPHLVLQLAFLES